MVWLLGDVARILVEEKKTPQMALPVCRVLLSIEFEIT